jgi:hypothetical protein
MSTARRTREASRRATLRAGGAALALTFALSLGVTAGVAQAVVVNDAGTQAGVALMPGTSLPGGMAVTTPSGCPNDPALTSDVAYFPGSNPLCYHAGGAILPQNETFAITWDANRSYWAGTRSYVQQFLKDVADGSATGQLSSPYALTTQYTDGRLNPDGSVQRAAYDSKYGGGCIDYGNPNNQPNQNTTCLYGNAVQTGPGTNFGGGCAAQVSGTSYNFSGPSNNDVCLTDDDIQHEIQSVATNTQMLSHLATKQEASTTVKYSPLVVVLLPPQVEMCLDTTGTLCSANSNATGKFCSYHSHVDVNGTDVAYVVQPWTALTNCDEPDATPIPQNPPVDQLASDVGQRLVSPISQGAIASIINPDLDGWYAAGNGSTGIGSEINDDNGCVPEGNSLDKVTVGSNPYLLQREWDNAAALETDPNTYFGCAPNVLLNPTFVVPSAVNQTDVVMFDGSTTASTLLVPNGNYKWTFGDGTSATGPSVVHSYNTAGTYSVTLNVTDRGGNQRSLTQTITVLGPTGQTPTPPTTVIPHPGGGSAPSPAFQVRLQLSPRSLKSVLRNGLSLQVRSNKVANGILTVSISRAEAKRLHIKVGRGRSVVIARGTTAGIRNGVSFLSLRLPHGIAAKLKKLRHATFTVRLSLVAAGGGHLAIDAAGRY